MAEAHYIDRNNGYARRDRRTAEQRGNPARPPAMPMTTTFSSRRCRPAFSTRLSDTGFRRPNGAIGAAESDGNVVTFNPTGTLGNIALTDANGDPLDGDDSGLDTTGGEDILLYTDTNDNIVLGKTAGGTLVFAIYLEETGGPPPTGAKLWTVQYEAIDHGDDNPNDHDSAVDLTGLVHVTAFEEQNFSFSNAPSGQNLFMAFGNDVAGDPRDWRGSGEQIRRSERVERRRHREHRPRAAVTPRSAPKVSRSRPRRRWSSPSFRAPIPTSSFRTSARARRATRAISSFTGYVLTQAAEFTISQMTPGGSNTTATVELAAYVTADAAGDGYINNNPLVTGDTPINITPIRCRLSATGSMSSAPRA